MQEFQKLQLSSPLPELRKSQRPQGEGQPVSTSSERATGTEATAAPDQNRVAEDIVQDRERDFNKDWYFKLNAAPGAEGRQVDVKDWKN